MGKRFFTKQYLGFRHINADGSISVRLTKGSGNNRKQTFSGTFPTLDIAGKMLFANYLPNHWIKIERSNGRYYEKPPRPECTVEQLQNEYDAEKSNQTTVYDRREDRILESLLNENEEERLRTQVGHPYRKQIISEYIAKDEKLISLLVDEDCG